MDYHILIALAQGLGFLYLYRDNEYRVFIAILTMNVTYIATFMR